MSLVNGAAIDNKLQERDPVQHKVSNPPSVMQLQAQHSKTFKPSSHIWEMCIHFYNTIMQILTMISLEYGIGYQCSTYV